jgi:hypothetical protein
MNKALINRLTGFLLCLLLGACGTTSVSPEAYVTSWHSRDKPSGESYNSRNQGLGVHIAQSKEGLRYGLRGAVYRNSIDKTSVYIAPTIDYCEGETWHGCIGAQAGIVSGYNDSVKPLVAPVVGLGYERITLNLTAFPIQNGHGAAVSGWLSFKAFSF